MLTGDTYKKRTAEQLREWVKGNPIHNTVDDECCPDFSCCKPEFLQPVEIRKTFQAASAEQREGMLFSFLSGALSGKGVEVIGSINTTEN